MHIVDDPLLALILRFVVDTDQSPDANEQFLQIQLRAMRRYLDRFPEQEQGERAMDWIERHAKEYRRSWQRREASRRTFHLRCVDCPLAGLGMAEHCEIHEQWLYLLRRYISGEVASAGFVEGALELLRNAKEHLGSRLAKPSPLDQRTAKPKPEKKKKGKKRKKAQDPDR
jgi:hypothetical protein